MNKIDILKKLLPGFLPLFVFIIADEIWGTKIGLIVALSFGIIEMIYKKRKEKVFDKFIIFDTLLLLILLLVSILLKNDVFFKLKPALIESIFCIILGYSAFSSNNIMLLMSKRYMKDISFSKEQEKKMINSIRILFFIFLFHTSLVYYSVYFMSKKQWAFISGGLFYIIFGIYFLFEIIKTKIEKRKYKNEEWLPIIDENGNILGKAPRSICHSQPGMLHPVVHLHVFNSKGELFLQKRALNKEVQPGKWDTAVGGHISFGEDLEIGLQRETFEEIGIKNYKPELFKQYKWDSKIESEMVFTFVTKYDGTFNINKEELEDGRFWNKKEIEKNIGKGVFTPNFEFEFDFLSEIF